MIEAEIQLQNALLRTFQSNLVFLSNYDNHLYERVDNLSRMIEDGSYKERYFLEFIMENGDFDIYDTSTNNYLYGRKPKNLNDNLIKNTDLKLNKTILNVESFFSYKLNPTIDINYKLKSTFSSLVQNQMQEYSKTLNDYLDSTSTKILKEVKKFIFFGTLTGRHIPEIAKKLNASLYFVIEKNLEIFRLSLFTIDYSILTKNYGVIFSIMDDDIDFEKKLSLFLNINAFDNYLIKFIDSTTNFNFYYNTLISTLTSMKSSYFDYARYLYIYLDRTTKYIQQQYDFLKFDRIKKELNIFKDIPILYIAAGPSLDENIDWIYENQNKFYIVAIGSIYKKLLNKNIKVDLVTTVDEQKWLEHIQFPNEIIDISDSSTIYLASSITNQKLLKKLQTKNLFLFEVFESLFKDNYSFSGYTIGEITLDILLQLNCKQIYLIGLDLSINQTTGETHSSDASSGTQKINLDKKNNDKYFSTNDIIKVKGNFNEEIKTIQKFYGSIKDINIKISKKSLDTSIYNLSDTGAYFENTIPTNINLIEINKFKIINKKDLNINEIFKQFSENDLDKDSKSYIMKELEYLTNILKKELYEINQKDFKSYEEFKVEILKYLKNLKDNNILNFYKLINIYHSTVIPYLNYHFNDRGLNQEYKKLRKIKIIYTKQINLLLEDYILSIERLIK